MIWWRWIFAFHCFRTSKTINEPGMEKQITSNMKWKSIEITVGRATAKLKINCNSCTERMNRQIQHMTTYVSFMHQLTHSIVSQWQLYTIHILPIPLTKCQHHKNEPPNWANIDQAEFVELRDGIFGDAGENSWHVKPFTM